MPDRLKLLAPELAALVRGQADANLRLLAQRAGTWICEVCGVSGPQIDGALKALDARRYGATPERESLGSLIEVLDEEGWRLGERHDVEETPRSYAAYVTAFSKARAVNALWYALAEDPFEAAAEGIYEAQSATDDLPGLLKVLDLRR